MTTFTINEVADQLKVSYDTVWKAVRTGKLSAYRLGESGRGTVRIKQVDLDSWLESRRIVTEDPMPEPARRSHARGQRGKLELVIPD